MFDKLKKAGSLLKEAASEGVDSIKDGATSLAEDAKGRVSELTTTTYTVTDEEGRVLTNKTIEQVITICASKGLLIEKEN